MKEQSIVEEATFEDRFESIFLRVLAGESVDFYKPDANLSRMFEIIAANLMADIPERKYMWYDGVVPLNARIRKARQVEFTGEMWVGGARTQWKEDFKAIVTDKRVTKQGIWIALWIGSDKAEGDLAAIFGSTE